MKKNIYFIDISPMHASKILEALKDYFNDNKISANLKLMLTNLDNSTSNNRVEYYQNLCDNHDISFEYFKDLKSLKHAISIIERKNSLVLLNPLMDEKIFYFCRDLLDSMDIKFRLIATCSWYEKEKEYKAKLVRFKEIYEQKTKEVVPEIFGGQNLNINHFVENDAKKLLYYN